MICFCFLFEKVSPNFDQNLLPLVAIYAEVMVFQARYNSCIHILKMCFIECFIMHMYRCSESQTEYNDYMTKFETFLLDLSIHPSLAITASQRVKILLSNLTSFVTSSLCFFIQIIKNILT